MTEPATLDVGTILCARWGYDQTNIDYYQVVKRTEKFVTLARMTSEKTASDQWGDRGTCEPGQVIDGAKTLRRKVIVWDGEEQGVSINDFTWARRWSGTADYWSSYA